LAQLVWPTVCIHHSVAVGKRIRGVTDIPPPSPQTEVTMTALPHSFCRSSLAMHSTRRSESTASLTLAVVVALAILALPAALAFS